MDIDKITSIALNKLPLEFITPCLIHNYFVSLVMSKGEYCVLIDTQKKRINNENEFIEHSEYLRYYFSNIRNWHYC